RRLGKSGFRKTFHRSQVRASRRIGRSGGAKGLQPGGAPRSREIAIGIDVAGRQVGNGQRGEAARTVHRVVLVLRSAGIVEPEVGESRRYIARRAIPALAIEEDAEPSSSSAPNWKGWSMKWNAPSAGVMNFGSSRIATSCRRRTA